MTNFIEIPATKNSLSRRKLLFGVGINDANYIVTKRINGKKTSCPYYRCWADMIKRSYNNKYQEVNPSYVYCSVTTEWLTFTAFKVWMKAQDWIGKELDKDLLIPDNKEYGPDSCIFVSRQINGLLTNHAAARGKYPQGVGFNKSSGKYVSSCNIRGKRKSLGRFTTENEAELVYLSFKSELIEEIAYEEEATSNPKLQAALLRHSQLFAGNAFRLYN